RATPARPPSILPIAAAPRRAFADSAEDACRHFANRSREPLPWHLRKEIVEADARARRRDESRPIASHLFEKRIGLIELVRQQAATCEHTRMRFREVRANCGGTEL